MSELLSIACTACQIGSPLATKEERAEYLPQIPQWTIDTISAVDQLIRIYEFPDFKMALSFTNLVGALAESQSHHPEIVTEWGKVTIKWWTHKIKGLHVNDFVLAAKTDQLLD